MKLNYYKKYKNILTSVLRKSEYIYYSSEIIITVVNIHGL